MDVTTALAVIGAISGVGSTVLQILSHAKNRPIIVVEAHPAFADGARSRVVIDVRNEGRHGVTLTDVGMVVSTISRRSGPAWLRRMAPALVARRDDEIGRSGVSYSEFAVELDDEGRELDSTYFLEPGRRLSVQVPMEEAFSRHREGMVSSPYAEDFAGRTYYAESPAHVQAVRAQP